MPYPTPNQPGYCPASDTAPDTFDPTLQWQRCDTCHRPIVARRDGRLYPHLDRPTRRKDSVQETLIAAGLNRREDPVGWVYAPEAAGGD